MTQSFDAFFYLHLNQRLSRQWRRWWFEAPLRSLWCHCSVGSGNLLQYHVPCFTGDITPWFVVQIYTAYLFRDIFTHRNSVPYIGSMLIVHRRSGTNGIQSTAQHDTCKHTCVRHGFITRCPPCECYLSRVPGPLSQKAHTKSQDSDTCFRTFWLADDYCWWRLYSFNSLLKPFSDALSGLQIKYTCSLYQSSQCDFTLVCQWSSSPMFHKHLKFPKKDFDQVYGTRYHSASFFKTGSKDSVRRCNLC